MNSTHIEEFSGSLALSFLIWVTHWTAGDNLSSENMNDKLDSLPAEKVDINP